MASNLSFLLLLFLSLASLSLIQCLREDPRREFERLERCVNECYAERRWRYPMQCVHRCEEKLDREKREGRGQDVIVDEETHEMNLNPLHQYDMCRRFCTSTPYSMDQCLRECREKYKKDQEVNEERHEIMNLEPQQRYTECRRECGYSRKPLFDQRECLRECRERYEEASEEELGQVIPFVFRSHKLDTRFSSEYGRIRVLRNFAHRSNLLRGLQKYRFATLDANPNGAFVPRHFDAEAVVLVIGGSGTIALVRQNKRKSYKVETGDILAIQAGTIVYGINHESRERLRLVSFLKTIAVPGFYKPFILVGDQSQAKSVYGAFSSEILEPALNTRRSDLERIFGQQKQGEVVRASQEHIRALSKSASSGELYNLLHKKKPVHSNEYGQYFVATPNDCDNLKDMDVSVSFMNITRAAMIEPFYNSKATKVVWVVRGSGNYEMICPHLGSQSQQGSQQQQQEEERVVRYQKVAGHLSADDVLIVLADHPVTFVASRDEDLELISFGINAQDNYKTFLAGKENVWNAIEPEAKELAFNLPANEVEEILNRQKRSVFVPGPQHPDRQREEREERGGSVASVLNFAPFF